MMSLAIVFQRGAGPTWIRVIVTTVSSPCRVTVPSPRQSRQHLIALTKPTCHRLTPPAPVLPGAA
jgi:hypothetical protein